jgi:golgin subfamily B member 1
VFHYRKAFELDPSLLEAIYAARQIYLAAGNAKAAATLYDLEANAESDLPRKVALLRELAQLRLDPLGDIEGAVVALKRAHTASPGDLAVKHELANALVTRASHLGDAGDKDRRRAAELFFELAQSVPDHALPYCEATLDAMPGHVQAMEVIEQLAEAQGREDLLPMRWVEFLIANPSAPGSDRRRERLGHAYVAAGQIDDAIACFEPMLDRAGVQVAEALAQLYRDAARLADLPRPLTVLVDLLPPDERLPRLRELVQVLLGQGMEAEAAQRAREILDLDPTDGEALALVDRLLRGQGEHAPLRELLTGLAKVPGLPADMRKARWLEVAQLSETDLNDPTGALEAWREVVQLDRSDRDAQQARLRLLEQAGRWDDAAWALGSWLEAERDPDVRADLLERLATVHREHRSDAYSAIDALRSLRELRPEDDAARTTLCELLLQVDRALDAIPVLRESIERTSDPDGRVELLRKLAVVLEERAADLDGAFEAWRDVLDVVPDDLPALDRMESLDMRQQRYERLFDTLALRVDVLPPQERPAVLRRMAAMADERLGDLASSALNYEQALTLEPDDDTTAEALADVLTRAERWADLAELLRARADRTEDPKARAELFRRRALTLAERLEDADAAADAWRQVLEAGDDEQALRALRRHARDAGDDEALCTWLTKLGSMVPSPDERRALHMERADLLAGPLGRAEEAQAVLRQVVDEVSPNDLPALIRLAEVCDQLGDDRGLAEALARHLDLADAPEERVALAARLARLRDDALKDAEGAMEAYASWAAADPGEVPARERLAELFEAAERWESLVAVLDELAGLARGDDAVGELRRRAAHISLHHLGDVDGAWRRLQPRVEAGDPEAEGALLELALGAGRAEQMAELYVQLAKAAEAPLDQRARWIDACNILAEHVGDAQRALEAMLRAFATDVSDESLLGEVDRLAAAAGAWLRLAQVYETLIRQAGPDDARRLLLRHADLLEARAEDASAAFDRVVRAAIIEPMEDPILDRAEALATKCGRAAELLPLFERRRGRSGDPAVQLESLLRAVRWCEGPLDEPDRGAQYLRDAVQVALQDMPLLDYLEQEVRDLDGAAGGDRVRRALLGAYRQVAASRGAPGASVLQRAARMLLEELEDPKGAHEVLTLAAELAPANTEVLDAQEALAREQGKMAELDGLLVRLIDESLDSSTAAELLRRRGRLLEAGGRHGEAAEVYRRLIPLSAGDASVFERLRACLRQAGDFQALLLVLDQELGRVRDTGQRLELLRDVARTWEKDLRNRWEAHDNWKKVLALAPDDAEATEAVERLGRRRLSDDESLFSDRSEPSDAAEALGDEEPADAAQDAAPSATDESSDSRAEAAEEDGEVTEEIDALNDLELVEDAAEPRAPSIPPPPPGKAR